MLYVNNASQPAWQGKRSLVDSKCALSCFHATSTCICTCRWFHTVMAHSRRVRPYDPSQYTQAVLDFHRIRW